MALASGLARLFFKPYHNKKKKKQAVAANLFIVRAVENHHILTCKSRSPGFNDIKGIDFTKKKRLEESKEVKKQTLDGGECWCVEVEVGEELIIYKWGGQRRGEENRGCTPLPRTWCLSPIYIVGMLFMG